MTDETTKVVKLPLVGDTVMDLNIYERLTLIAGSVGAMDKTENKQQGFKAFAVDDVYSKLRPLFSRFGVTVVPQVKEVRYEHITSKSGTAGIAAYVTMKYRLCAPDGSHVTIRFAAEGNDYGDKATNKAVQQAFKYALIQMFMISTGEVDPDHEAVVESAPSKPAAPETEKPLTAAEKRGKEIKNHAWMVTGDVVRSRTDFVVGTTEYKDARVNLAKDLVAHAIEAVGEPTSKTKVSEILDWMDLETGYVST